MRGPRLPRQASAFSEGSGNVSAFVLLAERFAESRKSRTRAVRRAAAKARSSVRAMKSAGTYKMRTTAEYYREQITFLGDEEALLNRSSLPAGQHGCDQDDFAKHCLRQHARDRLSCIDLILIRYEDEFVFGAGDFTGSKQVKELRLVL